MGFRGKITEKTIGTLTKIHKEFKFRDLYHYIQD